MTCLVVTLKRFRETAETIGSFLGAEVVEYSDSAFSDAFSRAERIVAVMSTGIAVRAIAPLLSDKWSDPAVVVVTPDLAFAIPLAGGHHGANTLATSLEAMGAMPVITTATERAGKAAVEVVAESEGCRVLNRDVTRTVNAALLDGEVGIFRVPGPAMVLAGPGVALLVKDGTYGVGLGCRKGTTGEEVVFALQDALELSGIRNEDVAIYATTEKKSHEPGLIAGVRAMGGTLLLVDDATLMVYPPATPSKAGKIGLSAVAEPCALAVSEKKELVLKKTVFGRVTVAIAK